MYYYIIDGSTYTSGKRLSIRIRKILERWNRTVITDELLGYPIQMESRYTWFYMFT